MTSSSPELLSTYACVSLIDFEFQALNGNRPNPVCLVVKDFRSGTIRRYWKNELKALSEPPFPTGQDALVVAYFASAEIGCMLELEWGVPENVLDLFAEHRVETNCLQLSTGDSFLGALAARGIPCLDVAAKDTMRDLILTRSWWSPEEQKSILDYCCSDVEGLDALLRAMLPTIDLPRALLRGSYTVAVARMERVGIPIDVHTHRRLVERWDDVRHGLVEFIDKDYGLYDGLTFKRARFSEWLRQRDIPWPKSASGLLKLDDDTFKDQATVWPQVQPLRELRQALHRMYLPSMEVGTDGRSRTLLSPFRSKTGRNQPSAKKFAFSLSRWQRGVIKPPEGWGIAYIDFASQEIGIAAGLSGDERLIEAYNAGDPYLAFAKQAGLVPPNATRQSHEAIRNQCKQVVLGLNYGLGADKMAYQAGISPALALELIQRHRQTYPHYWKWSEDVVTNALLNNRIASVFGWQRHLNRLDRATSLMNFPMQANGAEMMRLAAIAATGAGIEVCAPVHDAFLIAAPLVRLDEDVAHMRELMGQAGEVVAGGVRIRTDAKIVRFPDRYIDEGGSRMWNLVVTLSGIPDARVSDQRD